MDNIPPTLATVIMGVTLANVREVDLPPWITVVDHFKLDV